MAFVGLGSPDEAAAFRQRHRLDSAVISDAGGDLYREFGLPKGAFSLRILPRAAAAMARGHFPAMSQPHPSQLGGAFVIDLDGSVVWEHRARDASDIVRAAALLAALP
ncbi:MAG: hypothetical protein HYR64_03545 [Fimbriimonas ginsengisoli]|uniref:Redoxin domain-containing protein n=1 Tax=Fimbriimonas ginsengisoli TaxID=1005039 RepID=A0A931PU46_FIMGI|nr:hypothetical protein [Fimbriimonas ginsengisoli]